MKTRSKFASALLVTAMTLAGMAGLAGPAHAADTTATFTITAAGGLAVTAPESKALGSAASGATSLAGVQLGAVAVTDSRGALLGTWTASVTSSDFTTGAASENETIGKANASYWSGAATASSGTAVFLPGQAADLNKVTMDVSRTAFSASAIVGNNSATWNPTVSMAIPATAVAGSYSGTITHSVA